MVIGLGGGNLFICIFIDVFCVSVYVYVFEYVYRYYVFLCMHSSITRQNWRCWKAFKPTPAAFRTFFSQPSAAKVWYAKPLNGPRSKTPRPGGSSEMEKDLYVPRVFHAQVWINGKGMGNIWVNIPYNKGPISPCHSFPLKCCWATDSTKMAGHSHSFILW